MRIVCNERRSVSGKRYKQSEYMSIQRYDHIGKKKEGFIRVKIGVFPNQKCGFIDENFNEIISPVYTNVKDFREGMAAVKIGNWATGKWGFINPRGTLIIPCIFQKTWFFSDGFCKVVYEGQYYFIDNTGRRMISLSEYTGGSSFHDGFAIVAKFEERDRYNTRFGIIDKSGYEVIPCTEKCYHYSGYFSCNELRETVTNYQNRKLR